MTSTPGADTSGLTYVWSSRVTGPRLLKYAISSEESVAPTVHELSSSPGQLIVLDVGPSLPAATTGITPAATTLFIVSANAVSCTDEPPLKLIIRALLVTAHWTPRIQSDKYQKPSESNTFATIKFVPGATPVCMPLAPVPEIVPDT